MSWTIGNDGIFRIISQPLGGHTVSSSGIQVLSRAELERPSCPACYRPTREEGYCPPCASSGAAERHQANREAGW